MWLKVYKTFRGGRSKNHYIKLYGHGEEKQKEVALDWAERSPGGQSYGWVVFWDLVKYPPLEWLQKELKQTVNKVQRQNEKILFLLGEIESCQNVKN